MKSTGIVRKIDELGRIVLPVEFRRTLEIAEKDTVEMSLEGDTILLRKHETVCVFCGSGKNLRTYKNKPVCVDCVKAVTKSV